MARWIAASLICLLAQFPNSCSRCFWDVWANIARVSHSQRDFVPPNARPPESHLCITHPAIKFSRLHLSGSSGWASDVASSNFVSSASRQFRWEAGLIKPITMRLHSAERRAADGDARRDCCAFASISAGRFPTRVIVRHIK